MKYRYHEERKDTMRDGGEFTHQLSVQRPQHNTEVTVCLFLQLRHPLFIQKNSKKNKYNTRSRTQKTLLIVYNTFLKAQPEDGSTEISRNM
jgi:hypothetical protein